MLNRGATSPPELIARTIAKAVQAHKPQTRYAVGFGAKPMIFLHDVLPDRTFDAFMRRTVGVPSNYPTDASNTRRRRSNKGDRLRQPAAASSSDAPRRISV